MRESLRARLLLWHTTTGVLIVVAFAASVCYLAWRTRLADVDARLAARAASLADAVVPTSDDRIDLILGPGLRYEDAPELYHAIWAKSGAGIDRSNAELAVPRPSGPGVRIREGRRELTIPAASGVLVLVGSDLAPLRRDLWSLGTALATLGGGILVLSIAGGWWFVGRALEPLDRINRTARRMTDGDLAARISVDAVDTEIGLIARALNSAFDRLQAAVDRQRRFTADASHELRTPLTTMSTELQWAAARPRSADELRASVDVCARAAGRMQSVIERLLLLARDEAAPDRSVQIRLDELVREAVEHVSALSIATNVAVTVDALPAIVHADPDRLREAVTNVLTNAIRYNVDGGRVAVRVREERSMSQIAIEDTGIGIAPTDLPFVFDPFFRGDPARSRDTGGAGLGLAVARSIVERHGGTISCSSTPGEGTAVLIEWPQRRAG